MAQELDLIFETLREIKRANTASSESFERLLASIANKLELIDRNSASSDFIKAYMSEITKNADDRYQTALVKFTDIEKALKAIFNGLDEHVKTPEMQELFDVFSKNMNSAYSEIRQQKAHLAGIENKLSEIASNKSDKEDILRTITLLRNDFENLNHSYKYTIDTVSSELKNIINGIIQTDQTAVNMQITEQAAGIQKNVTEILNFLSSLDKRDAQLEMLLSSVATSESLKFTQSVIDTIVKKSDDIYTRLSETAEKSDVKEILSASDFLKQKLEESVTKELFANLVETANSLVTQTDNLKTQLANVTKDIETIPDTTVLEETTKKLYEKLTLINEKIDNFDSRQMLEDLSGSIKNVASELDICKNIVSDLNEVVNSEILESIDKISFANEAYDIKNHVTEMLKELPQKDDIEKILDTYNSANKALKEILKHTDKILDKVDKLPTHADMEMLNNNQLGLVENLQEVANKSDISDVSSKIDNVKDEVQNVNFDKEFENLYDKTSSIENWLTNSKIKERTEEIAGKINDKPNRDEVFKILETMETVINCVEELSQNADAKKVRNTLSDVYQMIEDLKNDFISTAEMHNDTIVVNLSEIQNKLATIATGADFNSFVEEVKDFLNSMLAACDKTEEDYKAIYEYQQAVLNKLEAVNTDVIKNVLDLKSQVKDVQAKLSSVQNWLDDSNIKENTQEILNQVKEQPDKEDILKVLNTVESIVEDLNELSQKDNTTPVIDTIAAVGEKIENLVNDSSKTGNETLVSEISNLKSKFDSVVTGSDFSSFAGEIKEFLNNILSCIDKSEEKYSEISEYQQNVLNKLDALNTDAVKEFSNLNKQVKEVKSKVSSLQDWLSSSNIKENTQDLLNRINEKPDKEDVLKILKVVESIVGDLSEISQKDNTTPVLESVSGINDKLDKLKEDLTNSAKTDIETVIEEISLLQNKIEAAVTGENFNSVTSEIKEFLNKILSDFDKTDENYAAVTEILQNIAGKTEKIEALNAGISQNISEIQTGVNDIQAKVSSVQDWLNGSNLKENTQELLNQIKEKPDKDDILKVLKVVESIVGELSEISQNDNTKTVIDAITNISEEIEDLKEELTSAHKSGSDKIIADLSGLQEKVDSVVTGSEFNSFVEELKEFLNNILSGIEKTEENYSAISAYQQNVLNKLETLNADTIKELLDLKENVGEVKSKVASIQDWLTNSRIKENTEELLNQVKEKSDKEDVLKVLKVVESIVGELSEISQNDDSQTVNETLSDVCKQIEDLRSEFIATSESQNDAVVEHLSEIQASIENIVSGDEFENFSDEIKHLLDVIVSNTDKINSDYIAIKEYQVAILDKLDSINIQAIKDIVENRSTVVEDTLTSISEYLSTVNKLDTEEIKKSVLEIKELLESRKDIFDEFESNSEETIDILQNYLAETKRIIDLSDFAVAENVKNKLLKIEEDLLLYQGQNENALTEIIAKLNEYQDFAQTLDEPYSNQDLKASMQEISEIKDMILTLGETYKSIKYEEESKDKDVADFVIERLDDLGSNLDDLTRDLDTRLQQGFAYNAALIEEKTAMLIEFIQDIRNEKSQNSELYEHLGDTDSKLTDYKQELDLINTDVISTINAKSDRLLEEIEPIKQMLNDLFKNTGFVQNIGADLTDLHQAISENIKSDDSISQATLGRLDYTYEQISQDLKSIEENVKTRIMEDIDSVLRKVDDLQNTVEQTLGQIVPPDTEDMRELKEFAAHIADFKNSQREILTEVADDIKAQMQEQHEELKSLLTVSLNNDKIINAIDELKFDILGKALEIRKIQAGTDTEKSEDTQDETQEENKGNAVSFKELQTQNDDVSLLTRQVLVEIRSDYNKFAEIVRGLSGENSEIRNILKSIQEKMNNIVVRKISGDKPDEEKTVEIVVDETRTDTITDSLPSLDNDVNRSVLTGEDNFNFIEALDYFKSDVKNLHNRVTKELSPEECQTAINQVTLPHNFDPEEFIEVRNKVNRILKRINSGEWLEEIKSYITDGKIGTTLELILGKLDILALTDSCDWVQDVKTLVSQLKDGALSSTLDPKIGSMIELLNAKVDILAESDDYELFEELRDMLANIQIESSIETSDLLNLINRKLDVLASADGDFDLDDLKDKLNIIEEKIDTIVNAESSSDNGDNGEYVDDLMYTLLNVEDKVDKIHIGSGIEGVDDIRQKVEHLTQKLDEFAKIAGVSVADEVGEKLALIESKIDILADSDNDEFVSELKDKLGLIESKVDILADSDNDEFVSELKDKLGLIESKVDIIADSDNNEVVSELKDKLSLIESKVDVLAGSDSNELVMELKDKLSLIESKVDIIADTDNDDLVAELKDRLNLIEGKIDIIADSENTVLSDELREKLELLEEKLGDNNAAAGSEFLTSQHFADEIKQRLDLLDAKVDIVANTDNSADFDDIRTTLEQVEENLSSVKNYSDSDIKITAILEVINNKIDALSKNGNEYSQKEFKDIKDLIMAQMDYIDSLEHNQKTEAVKKCLKELTVEVSNLNTVQNTKQIQKTIKEMKESLMAAVVAVFEQVSFVEESEDIKDFVEEKTDEINQNLAAVTDQLKQITNTEDASDYTYSMQDIESDLAKLRLALKDLQTNEQENQAAHLSSLLENINKIGSSVSELQSALSKDELLGLQLNFDKINTDIVSLTKLSKHIIAASGETYNALNNNFEVFGKALTEQLTTKVDKVTKLLEKANDSDAVMRQALIYVGEWIDSASDSMNKISTNSEEIVEVKSVIESLKKDLPEQTVILNSLEEKFDEQQERLAFFEKQVSKLTGIENKFEEQQERIDRLEMAIEKILSAVEDIDDTKVTRKIDKIDKQIAKLSINVEKLASYVD